MNLFRARPSDRGPSTDSAASNTFRDSRKLLSLRRAWGAVSSAADAPERDQAKQDAALAAVALEWAALRPDAAQFGEVAALAAAVGALCSREPTRAFAGAAPLAEALAGLATVQPVALVRSGLYASRAGTIRRAASPRLF